MTARRTPTRVPDQHDWSFFTNHGHVLLLLTENPDMTMRDLAREIGITERAVQRIVAELEAAGYLTHQREGRRNHYDVLGDRPLRHPVEGACRVADLMAVLLRARRKASREER